MMPSFRAAVPFSLLAALLPAQNERPPEGFQLAVGLQQRGLHDEAAQAFLAFVKDAPNHALAAEAHYRLGQCRQELGANDEAKRAYEAALKAGGDGFALRPECRWRLGSLLAEAKDHAGAKAQFAALAKEVADTHYLRAAAHFAEGEAWRELGDDEQAAACFLAAAERATGEAKGYRFGALYQLGFARLRRSQWEPAAKAFAEAVAAAPDDAAKGECEYLAGDCRLRLGDPDGADAAFARAQRLGGEWADDATFGLGWVALARGDQPKAARAFARVIEHHADSPHVPVAKLERARALYRAGDAKVAQQELEALLASGPEGAVLQQAQELLGLCALSTGSGAAAVEALRASLQKAAPAERPRLSFALGEALSAAQQWEEAVQAYDAVPEDAEPGLRGDARYGACFALHALGRHEESIARAKKVLALVPAHRLANEARFAAAENHFALQQWKLAEADYAAVGSEGPLGPACAWKLAWCRYLGGDKKDAALRFDAVAKQKDHPNAEEALSMQALALLEAGDADAALQVADRYRARHGQGAFLDRTERVAARVLRQKGDLAGAQQRLKNAAAAAKARGVEADAAIDAAEAAELAFQQGDFQKASLAFAELGSRDDALGARALAGSAWCAFELGDDAACAKAIAKAKAHPAAAEELPSLLELASALAHRQQDWKGAIAIGEEFLATNGTHAKAASMRWALGVAQARNGDPAAARRTFESLPKDTASPAPDRVAYELAWACRRSGDEQAALRAFARASTSSDVELAGESHLHLGLAALEQKDLASARTHLAAVQGTCRGRAQYRLGVAEYEAQKGDRAALQRAREHFAAAASIEGEALAGEARYFAAECSHALGDEKGAVDSLRELLKREPKHERASRARLLLGECAVLAGNATAAVEALEPFVQKKDREKLELARAFVWLGRARAMRKEWPAAEAAFRSTTELAEGALAAEAQFRIGEGRMEQGDLRAAADAFVKLPILYAEASWVRRGLLQAALCYDRLQQPEKAQRFLKELIEKHDGTDEAATAREKLRAN